VSKTKIKVKRTYSKMTMKRLVRQGWTLQAVDSRYMMLAGGVGNAAYILVKQDSK
jgi:hypothetical protein